MKLKNIGTVGILMGLMGLGLGCSTPRSGNAGAGMNSSVTGQGSVVGSDHPANQSYGDVGNSSTGQEPYGLKNSTEGEASAGKVLQPPTTDAKGNAVNH